MRRRVDRPRVERLDDRTEDRLERRGHAPGELQLLAAARRERAVPRVAQQLARRVVGGSTRDAIRRPRYSSSVPAMASGTTGAPVRRAISAAPWRNGPIRPAGR